MAEWEPDDDERLREYFEEGYSDEELAQIFDVGPSVIKRRRFKLGLRALEIEVGVKRKFWPLKVTPEEYDLISRAAAQTRSTPGAWGSAVIANRVEEVLQRIKNPDALSLRFTEKELADLKRVAKATGLPITVWARIELIREANDVLYGELEIPLKRPRPKGRAAPVCASLTVHEDDLVFEAAELAGLTPGTWAFDILAHEVEFSGMRVANVPPKGGLQKPWPEERKARLRQMFAEGRSDKDMAQALGVDVDAVKRARYRLGLTRRAKWTSQMQSELTRLFRAGSSDPQIAQILGATRTAVKQQRRKLGLQREGVSPAVKDLVREYFDLGLTAEETAEQMGMKTHQIKDIRASMGLKKLARWTPEREQVIRDMLAAGASDLQIGEALGISTKAAATKRLRMGLQRGRGVSWTPELKQLVRDMHAAGASDEEIAQHTGSTVKGIQTLRSQMGVVREVFWTPQRDQHIRQMFVTGVPDQQMAQRLGVTVGALRTRRQQLGLLHREAVIWTPERDQELRDLFEQGLEDTDLADELDTTVDSIRARRGQLDLLREPKRFWTGARDQQLRTMFDEGLADQDMADDLGVSISSIRSRRLKLGLKRQRPIVWTRERDRVLQRMYGERSSDEQIAQALGVSPFAVINRRVRLRLGQKLLVEAPRTEQVCTRVTPKMHAGVKRLAARLRRPVSAWFREILLDAASRAVAAEPEELPRVGNLRRRLLA